VCFHRCPEAWSLFLPAFLLLLQMPHIIRKMLLLLTLL
jgi:hypothetical protein